MSKVVRVVGGVVGTAIGFIPGMQWLQAPSIAMLMGGVQEMLLRRPRISDPGDPFRDRTVNITDPVGGLPIVYGDMTLGVHRVWAHTEDEVVNGVTAENRFLYILCAVAHGPVAAMPIVYLDGVAALFRSLASPNRFINGPLLGGVNWFDLVHPQWASGTDGQQAVIPNTDPRTVSTIEPDGSGNLRLITTTAHPYEGGDVLRVTGNSIAGYNLPGGYTVASVVNTTTLLLKPRTGQPGGTGSGGTVDFYNMDPATIVSGAGLEWSPAKRGKGVAYLLVRVRYDETKFAGQVPQIEVNVWGRTIKDTRSVTTLTVSSTAAGPARTGYATTTDVTFTAAHGRAVGNQLLFAGHSVAYLNGHQRVDAVVSSTIVRIYTPHVAGSGGTAEVLTFSKNPAMIMRDYLVNTRYGVVVPTVELDETAFQTEANYCDESVIGKIPNHDRKAITATTTTNPTTIGVAGGHGLTSTFVRIFNHPIPAINGTWTVTIVDPNTFTIPYDNTGGSGAVGGFVHAARNVARYSTHTVLSPAESLKTNLEQLLTGYRAQMVYQGGIYRTWTRRVAFPGAFELTPDNIIPGTFRYHRPGLNEMANRVRATFYFTEPNIAAGRPAFAEWPSAVGYTNPELATEDNGFEAMHEIDLPCTTDPFVAEQIAQIVRAESRTGLVVGVTAKQSALQLAVGDVVNATHDTPQWNRKKFWVLNVGIQADALVRLTLLEYSALAYTTKWYPDEVA